MVVAMAQSMNAPGKDPKLVEDFIQRLAGPTRTGDKTRDAELKSVFRLLGQVAHGCVARLDAILPAHEASSEYVRAAESQYQPDCPPAEQFSWSTNGSRLSLASSLC